MNKYKLSIVIPTKNRQFYCIKAVEQVLKYTSENVQIIIQDNSDDSKIIESYIKTVKSDRLVYNYTKKVLSFVDNFSEAISLASGLYICMIGDDDGVLTNIESMVDYCIKNDIDCYAPSQNVVYIWPNENPIIKNAENGYLCISNVSASQNNVDCEFVLKKLIKQGFQDYQKLDVPRLYHGLVKKEILERIKKKTGHYFGGLTPDMYMIVALCVECKKVVSSKKPVTISGICPGSGSSASATGKHTGKLEEAPHFIGHTQYLWDERVPKIYTVETIWADTGLHALNDFGKSDVSALFDSKKFLSSLSVKYPQFKEEYKEYRTLYGRDNILRPFAIKINSLKDFVLKIFRKIFRKKGAVKKYYNVIDIESATQIILKEI